MDKKELKQLFEKIKKDKETIEELYNKYNRTIYAIAFSILKNKEDSEDAVQNVFMKISKLENEKLPSDKEATWIYTVTKNEALAILKKKNREINIDEIYEIEEQNSEIDEVIDKENFNKLISKLNDKEKEIVSLKIISNLSFNQIGKLIDEPVNTVKWRYYKSIYRIKMLLGNLAMFIITIILGSTTIKNRKKLTNDMADINSSEQNGETSPDSSLEEEPDVLDEMTKPIIKDEYNKYDGEAGMQKPDGYESILDTDKGSINEENKENIKNESTENQYEEQNTIQGTVTEQENQSSNQSHLEIGFIGISLIFLVITIIIAIFFKKHQLKSKKK